MPIRTDRRTFIKSMTETALMGCIANRFPKQRLVWGATRLHFKQNPKADVFLRRTYREGWEVEGLS